MPTPNENESRDDYMKRCVPQVMGEGLTQEQAVGKCEGMFDQHLHKRHATRTSKNSDEKTS